MLTKTYTASIVGVEATVVTVEADGPLLDHFDLMVPVQPMPTIGTTERSGKRSAEIREHVGIAWARQQQRLAGTGWHKNAEIHDGEVERLCTLSAGAERLMLTLDLDQRAANRLRRVARTIADFDGGDPSEPATEIHVAEAAHLARSVMGISSGT